MKKIIAFILVSALLFSLVACGCPEVSTESPVRGPARFIRIERFEAEVGYGYIYADTQTGVLYALYNPELYRSGFTPLINADGTPMIWEEFNK